MVILLAGRPTDPEYLEAMAVAIQPGWLGVRELGSGAGGGRGEGLVPDLL